MKTWVIKHLYIILIKFGIQRSSIIKEYMFYLEVGQGDNNNNMWLLAGEYGHYDNEDHLLIQNIYL